MDSVRPFALFRGDGVSTERLDNDLSSWGPFQRDSNSPALGQGRGVCLAA